MILARIQETKKLSLCLMIKKVQFENTEFVLSDYESNGRTTPLIKEWKEVITAVSDHQSLIMSLKESRYF